MKKDGESKKGVKEKTKEVKGGCRGRRRQERRAEMKKIEEMTRGKKQKKKKWMG